MISVAIYLGCVPTERTYWTTSDRLKYLWIVQLLSHFKTIKFVLLSDTPLAAFFTDYKNVEKQTIGECKLRYWSIYRHYNFKLSSVLKELKCDVFISLTGILPKRYNGKSCLLLPELISNIEIPSKKKALEHYRNRFLERSVAQADWIITLSHHTKQHLLTTFPLSKKKIEVAPPLISSIFQPLGWEEREEVKEEFADEREYLFYMGDFTNQEYFVNLLKSFSILKKKMSSGMVLVLSGNKEKTFKKFPKLLRTYHFRKDLKFTGELTEDLQAKLMGGAYACIIPSPEAKFSSPVAEMIQCHTPVFIPQNSVHEELAGDVGICFDPNNYEDIGNKLCDLYRDEEKRSLLIHHAENAAERQLSNSIITLFSDIVTL